MGRTGRTQTNLVDARMLHNISAQPTAPTSAHTARLVLCSESSPPTMSSSYAPASVFDTVHRRGGLLCRLRSKNRSRTDTDSRKEQFVWTHSARATHVLVGLVQNSTGHSDGVPSPSPNHGAVPSRSLDCSGLHRSRCRAYGHLQLDASQSACVWPKL